MKVELDCDDQRLARLAGLWVLEAVNDADAWRVFWWAVGLARRQHELGRARRG